VWCRGRKMKLGFIRNSACGTSSGATRRTSCSLGHVYEKHSRVTLWTAAAAAAVCCCCCHAPCCFCCLKKACVCLTFQWITVSVGFLYRTNTAGAACASWAVITIRVPSRLFKTNVENKKDVDSFSFLMRRDTFLRKPRKDKGKRLRPVETSLLLIFLLIVCFFFVILADRRLSSSFFFNISWQSFWFKFESCLFF